MKPTVNVFVNGIMNFPGASNNWNSNAVTHFTCYLQRFSEKLEYFSGPFMTRRMFQKRRAERLRKKLQRYIHKGWSVNLFAHSNGCDVVLDTLRDMQWPRIEEIHLLSAACESDFEENGLNAALRNNMVGHVFVYVAERDLPLKLAGTLLGMFFGYGTLGRTGPMRVCNEIQCVEKRVTVIRQPDFGHSTWFKEENFNDTMRLLARLEE